MMTESKAKPKAKGTSHASKPRKSATKSKSPPKAGAKARPGAEAQRPTGKAASRLIDEADPDIMEECKWSKPSNPLGVPVWSHAGIVCTGEAYHQVVKLTFARGA